MPDARSSLPDIRADYHRTEAAAPAARLVLVFVDGVGLAPAGADNPFTTAPSATLRRLVGGAFTAERVGQVDAGAVLEALDATLGVAGLPQSATGQTALFTGVNAAARVGRHVSAFPGASLRRLILGDGLLGRLRAAGLDATFANAYSRSFLRDLEAGEARRSVTTCLVQAAGLPFRTEADLAAGRAVSWDITRELFAARAGAELESIAAVEAGRHLAAVAREHRFTLFETFLTDLAGHGRLDLTAAQAIARVDGLLTGLLAAAPDDLTLLVTSDHGNLEESSGRLHTLNPVPLLAVGPDAERFAGLRSILDVAPAVVACLA